MYATLCLRSKVSLEQLCESFDDFTWKHRLHLAVARTMAQRALKTPDGKSYHSTASSPSLRSREPVDMERPFTPPDADGGNVKVVVRVRKFIRRGVHASSLRMRLSELILTQLQRSKPNSHA